MKQIIVEVPEKRFDFLMELLKNLRITKVKELTSTDEKVLDNIESGYRDALLIAKGKKKGTPIQNLLDAL